MLRNVIPSGIPLGIRPGSPEWDPKQDPEAGTPVTVTVSITTGAEVVCGSSLVTESIHRLGSRGTGTDAWMAADAAVIGGGF